MSQWSMVAVGLMGLAVVLGVIGYVQSINAVDAYLLCAGQWGTGMCPTTTPPYGGILRLVIVRNPFAWGAAIACAASTWIHLAGKRNVQ